MYSYVTRNESLKFISQSDHASITTNLIDSRESQVSFVTTSPIGRGLWDSIILPVA